MTSIRRLTATFIGPDALKQFLNPRYHPPLPLVEIPAPLNPFQKQGVRIFAKIMYAAPLFNVKSIAAYSMIESAARRGALHDIHTLIEKSSGNMALALSVIGKQFRVRTTKAVVSEKTIREKIQLLRFFGVDVYLYRGSKVCPPGDLESGIAKAHLLGKRNGWKNLDQYENADNPRGYERLIGPQIWEQTQGRVSLLSGGLGTVGTMLGVTRALKRRSTNVRAIGVTEAMNGEIPGIRKKDEVIMSSFSWQRWIDGMIEMSTVASYRASLSLCRIGVLVGPSTGLAYSGLVQYIRRMIRSRSLASLRNKHGEVVAVFLCPDTPFPYIAEYFRVLPKSMFASVKRL